MTLHVSPVVVLAVVVVMATGENTDKSDNWKETQQLAASIGEIMRQK